jgi:hypothetical protein
MATTSTATVATPAQPQTTVEPTGGPFIRHSEPGKGRIYDLTNNLFAGLINQPLTALPGYASKFRIRIVATGGVNSVSTNAVTSAGDAPESVVALITLWDALGTPIVSGPGYEILRLIPMFSGGFGLQGSADTHSLPSFSAVATGTATTSTGNFTFNTAIPLEFAKGYGVLGMADGDVLPKLQIQLAGSASVYTTAPTTVPTALEVRLNADYYWLPQGQDVAPPGLGTTRQWFLQQGNPQPAASTTATVTIPRQGGWLDTLIFICRDSLGVRQDAWPTIFRFNLDGIGEARPISTRFTTTWRSPSALVWPHRSPLDRLVSSRSRARRHSVSKSSDCSTPTKWLCPLRPARRCPSRVRRGVRVALAPTPSTVCSARSSPRAR